MDEARADFSPLDGLFLGFDLNGFSTAVEHAIEAYGPQAGERIGDALAAGHAAAMRELSNAKFALLQSAGDAALFWRADDAAAPYDMSALMAAVDQEFERAAGLRLRWSTRGGRAYRLDLPRPLSPQGALYLGGALCDLHHELEVQARRSALGKPFAAPPSPQRLTERALRAEIVAMTVIYCRLAQADVWRSFTTERARIALEVLSAHAAAAGAALVKLTFDNKGVLARLEMAGDDRATRAQALALAQRLQEVLAQQGFKPRLGLAAGTIYRGPAIGEGCDIHGPAVNAAAKRTQLDQAAINADESFKAPPSPLSRTIGDTGFLGRNEDLERIWACARKGASFPLIEGEAGIGKTQLLNALCDRARRKDFLAIMVRCRPDHVLEPYHVWRDGLRQAAAVVCVDGSGADWARARLGEAGIDPALMGLCADCLTGEEGDDSITLEGDARGEALRAVLSTLLRACARARALVFLVDDIQYADAYSLGFASSLLSPSLRVVMARRRAIDVERDIKGAVRHPLMALSAETLEDIVRRTLPSHAAHAREASRLAAGNPFFALQLSLALSEDAPGDRSAVLAQRLRPLTANQTLLMRAASVFAAPASAGRLMRLCARLGAQSADSDIAHLVERRLLLAEAEDERLDYRPAHALLVDTVLQRTPGAVFSALHRAAARELALTAGAANPGVQGFHWARAGAPGRAAMWNERAAKAAADLGAHKSAVAYYELAHEALAAAPGQSRSVRAARWRAAEGVSRWSLGQISEASANAKSCRSALAPLASAPRNRRALLTAAVVRAETGQFLGALDDIIAGNADGWRFAGDAQERGQARARSFAFLSYLAGLMRLEPFSALFFRMGVASAGPDDRRPAGFVYSARGVTRLAFGRWREAYALLEEALLCCKDHAEPQLAETAHTLIGLGLHFEGRWQEALARFDKVRALAAARDHLMHQGWADYATAQTLMALDRVAEAEPLLARAEDCLSNVADAQSHLICRGLRIQAHWRLGRVDRALELCGRAASDPTPPTNFGSLEGYAAPAHVAAQALAASPSDRDLYWLAMGAVKRLKSYALVFPIGRPRLSVVKAYLALPSSRPRAARHAACALDQALSLSMADERRFAQDAMQAATRS